MPAETRPALPPWLVSGVGVLLVALAPLAALRPLVGHPASDDEAFASARSEQHGWVADVAGPQFGLAAPARWRPLASAALSLAPEPPASRTLSLGLLLLCAFALAGLARSLGAGTLGAIASAAPLLCAPSLPLLLVSPELAPALLSLGCAAAAAACAARRAAWATRCAALWALLSVAAGFHGAALLLLVPLARGGGARETARPTAWGSVPVTAGAVALLLHGWLALREPPPADVFVRAVGGGAVFGPLGLLAAAALLGGLVARSLHGRPWALGALWGLLAVALAGPLAGAHAGSMTVRAAHLPLFAAAGLCVAATARRGWGKVALPLVLAGGLALQQWPHLERAVAFESAELNSVGARRAAAAASVGVGGEAGAEMPALQGVRRPAEGTWRGLWGLAAGMRGLSRPVWPRATLVGGARPHARRPQAGLTWPERAETRNVPLLPHTRPTGALRLDEAAVTVELLGRYPARRVELVVYTAHGYAASELPDGIAPDAGDPPASRPLAALRLPEHLFDGRVPQVEAALRLADAWGERHAYLEVRAVDDARGVEHRPLASTDWMRLEWGALD